MFGEGGEITLEKCHRWANESYYGYSGPALVAQCLGPFAANKFRAEKKHAAGKIDLANALWRTVQYLHAMG